MASSMKILVNKKNFQDDGPDNIANALNYLTDENTPGVYFRDGGSHIELDGEKEPEKMRELAQNWNRERREFAIKLLRELVEKPEFDTAKSYQARKAFDAADNNFGPGVDYAVVIDGTWNSYYETLIPAEMQKEIMAHPEDYCLVSVSYDF